MPGAEGTQTRDEKKHLEREKTAHDKRGLTLTSDKDGAGRHVRGYLDAELIPACFDDEGNLIDLGKARRLVTGPAHLALELRDRGCAWPGCDRPISWCAAHHILNPMHHPPPRQ